MIPQRNLSLLSNRLARAGGRRIPEAVLERDYCLSWFLVGLSRNPLRDRLLFKGGTALKKCYFADYRFSEDLDFTLARSEEFDPIRRELETAFEAARQASGVVLRYARDDRHPHANSYTFYLGYEGPLPGGPAGKEVKVDMTIREEVVFPSRSAPFCEAITNTRTCARTRGSKSTRSGRSRRRRWWPSSTGPGTSPATSTTCGTSSSTRAWISVRPQRRLPANS